MIVWSREGCSYCDALRPLACQFEFTNGVLTWRTNCNVRSYPIIITNVYSALDNAIRTDDVSSAKAHFGINDCSWMDGVHSSRLWVSTEVNEQPCKRQGFI